MNSYLDTRAPEYREADRWAGQRGVLPTVRARQGVTGHNVRYVLAFGIAAVIMWVLIIYFVYI
jgi:hypothetical protein